MKEFVEKAVPHSITRTAKMLLRFGPILLENAGLLHDLLWKEGALSRRERLFVHLRLAKLSRSPFALIVLPSIARMVGLDDSDIDAALDGEIHGLDENTARVVAWAESVARAEGEMPLRWPEQAREMTMRERERVLILTRLVLVLNSLALLPIPESLLAPMSRESFGR